MTETTKLPGTQKVRRRVGGIKGAPGHRLQAEGRRVRRPDPTAIRVGRVDKQITSFGGLARFGAYTRRLGVQRALHGRLSRLKTGKGVVYTMPTQVEMMIDAAVVGARRVFDFERLALDPLFTHVSGGAVCIEAVNKARACVAHYGRTAHVRNTRTGQGEALGTTKPVAAPQPEGTSGSPRETDYEVYIRVDGDVLVVLMTTNHLEALAAARSVAKWDGTTAYVRDISSGEVQPVDAVDRVVGAKPGDTIRVPSAIRRRA
ncbi:MAG: hypothetical protein ACHREM_15805 [Polyangiales bacterium]